jgi:hypothetical protein
MLRVIICCDVDHDIPGYKIPATRFDVYKEKLGWKSIENISKIREICNSVKDCESNNAKVTWFVRSDEQLKIIFNDYAYPLRAFSDLWKKLKQQGDEIGWHPHLWRWSEKNRCWYQEIWDNEWIDRCLEKGHREFVKVAEKVSSVRMGWGFHNNFTMKKINDLRLQVDLSAAPGLKRKGSPDERGSHFLNSYDWSITPEQPYYPSQEDYRRPAEKNEQSLDILVIPVTTAPQKRTKILIKKTLRLAPSSLRKKLFKETNIRSKCNQHRYVANITDTHFKLIAKQKLKQAQQNPEGLITLVTIFHPIELFQSKKLRVLEKNLKTLTELSEKVRVPLNFFTATQLKKEICSLTKRAYG